MRKPAPRTLVAFFILTLASVVGAFAFGPVASSQVVAPDARSTPDFGRLSVSPLNLSFHPLNFNSKKGAPASESKTFMVENTGRSVNTLMVTLEPINGSGAGSFALTPSAGMLSLLPGKSNAQPYIVTFMPTGDGRVTADIVITSTGDPSGIRGVATRTVHLEGIARGPIPTPSITPTPTPLMTTTPTPTATPTSTASPGATDKNSANAPGVFISGQTVTVFVPEGSDDLSNAGTFQVVVENGASPLPSPAVITTDRVNSCTPAQSGQLICSGQAGTVDLVPAASSSPSIQSISPLPAAVNYAGGDCIACGALVDDNLNLGIIASGSGFYLLNLSTGVLSTPIATNDNPPLTPDPSEVPGMDFGYDEAHHLILSANFQVTDLSMFMSSAPHFQIINIANPTNPAVFDLAEDQTFFGGDGNTCGAAPGTPSDTLPDTTALDTSTEIAYVSFHTKSECFNAPPDDIEMFDLSQASFNAGAHTWTTPAFLVQSISGTALNGIDSLSVESANHLAMVSAGDNNIGVLQLPAAAGGNSASLAITDWVNALMPNDPDGVVWNGWGEPNGVATYVSPNTGKVMGVLMNNPSGGGGSTYLALIDMQALLNAPRDTPPHQILGAIPAGIVSFIKIK
jgi:hypothetical protein